MYRKHHAFGIWLAIAAGICTVTVANAQVAVPPLNPAMPDIAAPPGQVQAGFVTLNPAATQWGAPSRFGLGIVQAETGGEGQKTVEFDGRYVGLRLVGELFSVAAEAVEIISQNRKTQKLDVDTANAALAGEVTDFLAIGGGYSREIATGATSETDEQKTVAGVSFRLAEMFFVGAAMGTEELKITSSGSSIDAKRDLIMVGAGVRLGGPVLVHAEYYVINRDPYKISGFKIDESESQVGVLELGALNFILGYRVTNTTITNAGVETKLTVQSADFAWAPEEGFTVGIHVEDAELEDDATGVVTTADVTALTVTLQF